MLNVTHSSSGKYKSKLLRYHLTPVRVAKMNKSGDVDAREDVEKREPSCTVGGNANWCSRSGKQYGGSSKKNKK